MADKNVEFVLVVKAKGSRHGLTTIESLMQTAVDSMKTLNTEGYLITDLTFTKKEILA